MSNETFLADAPIDMVDVVDVVVLDVVVLDVVVADVVVLDVLVLDVVMEIGVVSFVQRHWAKLLLSLLMR